MKNIEINNEKIDIDGYIGIVHEVIFMDKRIYLHRFFILDIFYKPLYLSYPFIYLIEKYNIHVVCVYIIMSSLYQVVLKTRKLI
jgi:hypothetical protein